MTGRYTARPTVYNGIKMRSRLEAGFAAWLDEWNFDWDYEPCAFGSEAGQYLPDFRVDDLHIVGLGPSRAYIEVKPEGWLDRSPASSITALVSSFQTIWKSDPTAFAILVVQGEPYPWVYAPRWDKPLVGRWVVGGDSHKGAVALAFDAPGPWPDGYWKHAANVVIPGCADV